MLIWTACISRGSFRLKPEPLNQTHPTCYREWFPCKQVFERSSLQHSFTVVFVASTVIFYTAASIERNASLYMLSGLPLGKIYSISMMVMLNNRLTIEGGRNIGDPSTLDAPVEFLSRKTRERRKKLGSLERGLEGRRKLERGMDGIVRRSVDSEKTVAGIEVGATWSKEAWLRDEVEG